MPGHNVNCTVPHPDPNNRAPHSGNLQRLGEFVLKLALDPAAWSDIDTPDKAAAELRARGFTVPVGVTIVFERRKNMEFKILVPQADIAEAAICEARKTATYDRLPPAYGLMADHRWPPGKFEDFYEIRVGDYCMGFCR